MLCLFLDLYFLDTVPYRTVRAETDPSCRILPVAFTDPRPTVPSVPCRHDFRCIAVCNKRGGRNTVFIFNRIQHGADYLRIREYVENTVYIYQYGSDMALLFTEPGLCRDHCIPLVMRIQFGADYFRIRDYGSELQTDRERIRARRYTSRYVFCREPSIVRNITIKYINKRFYVRSVFIFEKLFHNWGAVYRQFEIRYRMHRVKLFNR